MEGRENSNGLAIVSHFKDCIVGDNSGQWGDGYPADVCADFVKVYSFLQREAYFAIADEAKKQGIPFAGHVPFGVSGEEASDAGQICKRVE